MNSKTHTTSRYDCLAKCLSVFFCIVGCALALLFMAPKDKASAQRSNISLSISPPLADIIVKPGKNVVLAFNIENSGAGTLEVTPVIHGLRADKEGRPVFDFQTPAPEYVDLQNVDRKLNQSFLLPPGKKDQLILRIKPGEKVPEQDIYLSLVLYAKNKEHAQFSSSATSAQGGIATNILLTISQSGVRQSDLQIEKFELPLVIDTFSTIHPSLLFKNKGKNLAIIDGTVEIQSNLSRQTVKTFTLLQENVLSGGVRKGRASQPDPTESKSSIPAELAFHPPALFGPYTVIVSLRNAPPKQKTVWALPITPLLACLAFWLIYTASKRARKQAPIDNVFNSSHDDF